MRVCRARRGKLDTLRENAAKSLQVSMRVLIDLFLGQEPSGTRHSCVSNSVQLSLSSATFADLLTRCSQRLYKQHDEARKVIEAGVSDHEELLQVDLGQ